MKKVLFGIIALATIGFASANGSYYNSNKDVWTLQTSVWPVIYTSYVLPNGLVSQFVACNKVRNMCYTETTLKRLGFDVNKFIAGQEEVTGVKVMWQDLWVAVSKQ